MNRFAKLDHNQKHTLVENTDFMSRLRFKKENDLPSKIDCINISIQYMAIYKAIELRLNDVINENTLYLSIFNKEPWTDRSQLLKNDIRDMRSFLSDAEKTCLITNDQLFPAVQKMIDQIAEADPITLFAVLSLRCLSDVIDGQHLSQCYQQVFSKDKLKGEFYNGVINQIAPLSQFIDRAVLTLSEENRFDNAINNFFQFHIDLFDEMEEGRVLPETNEIVSPSLNYKNGCRYALFALSAVGLAASVAGAAYYGMASPQN